MWLRFSAQLLDKPLIWLKDRAANDENEYVRQAAVQELARGWKDDPQTIAWLRDNAITK